MFDAPARRVTSSQQVSHIYIRHYQGILVHVCKLLNSPSLESLKSLQTSPIVVDSSIYVAFAACAKFKLFFNGKLVLESSGAHAPIQPYYKLYGSYVRYSAAGIFSISIESCNDSNGFIGCIGPSVCTGMNDPLGWWCTRLQPPEGWMLPTYRIEAIEKALVVSKLCNFQNESDVWSLFTAAKTESQFYGMSAFPAATDMISCSLACCSDSACKMFQWCSNGDCNTTTSATGSRCWIGTASSHNPQTGWVSGTRIFSDPAGDWVHAQSQGTITSRTKYVEPGLDNRALWLWPKNVQSEVLHCRQAM